MSYNNIKQRLIILAVMCASVAGMKGCDCGGGVPKDCGENVKRVVSMDFRGPGVIVATPEFDFAGYDVTISIEKEDDSKPARVCYVVRDEDPWIKGPWAVDDVLDANFMTIEAGQNSRTIEGHFTLVAENDNEICGGGALPGDAKVQGCSGEREAEVYLQPIGSPGAESPRHTIRVE